MHRFRFDGWYGTFNSLDSLCAVVEDSNFIPVGSARAQFQFLWGIAVPIVMGRIDTLSLADTGIKFKLVIYLWCVKEVVTTDVWGTTPVPIPYQWGYHNLWRKLVVLASLILSQFYWRSIIFLCIAKNGEMFLMTCVI